MMHCLRSADARTSTKQASESVCKTAAVSGKTYVVWRHRECAFVYMEDTDCTALFFL